jgi:lipopolysaccharide transport system ATP-binding protein
MPGDVVISARNLSKAYRLWQHPAARIKTPLYRGAARLFPKSSGPHAALSRAAETGYRDFHALHDLTLDVRRGQATGIIGRNGSGKSTLLQLITGILQPTTGTLAVRGRVSALLELGSGFNPEFTGRENVYLNGAIFGLGRTQIDAQFADIAAFADIGEFIDEPVKTYSSGMMMRLAFAVAVSVQPDILIVDEALSVGDVFFQQKCFKRLHEILGRGVTLLFVSHDMEAVRNLCEQVLLLDQGRPVFLGPPDDAVSRYYTLFGRRAAGPANDGTPAPAAPVDAAAAKDMLAHNLLPLAKARHGDRPLEIVALDFRNEHGAPSLMVEMTRTATLRALIRANEPIADPGVGIDLYDRMNNLVFAAGTRQLRVPVKSMQAGEERIFTFRITCNLQPGQYTFGFAAGETSAEGPNFGVFHDRLQGIGPLVVHYEHNHTWPFYGIARLPLEIIVT